MEIQLSRVGGWHLFNWFNPPHYFPV